MFESKNILITGAGRGIGRALAIAFAKEGAFVGCLARTHEEVFSTVKDIEISGGSAEALIADVSDFDSVSKSISSFGSSHRCIDILFLNAGISVDRERLENSNPANWKKVIDVNLIGAYYCSFAALPYLKKANHAKIITIGSGLGHSGEVGNSAYCVSKAGLWMLTKVLGEELKPHQISVNELIPGPVKTYQSSQRSNDPNDSLFDPNKEWIKEPDDVIPLAFFLASQPPQGPSSQTFSLTRRKI
ncbi:MAG: SDR family oxidoreductase [Deltaproteobacteria bacterium]|nr:SDR family oxidoreductase [Deltaproteobacteria bacterium]